MPSAPYKTQTLKPAQRRLLAHCIATGGWMPTDPVKMTEQTVRAAAARGLVTIEESAGSIIGATITTAGRDAMGQG